MTSYRSKPAEADPVFHRAGTHAEGEGICRTCLAPIWNEGGTIGRQHRSEGWSDRIERGGDSLVCFKALHYRHVPLDGREAAIYDAAYRRGFEQRSAGDPCQSCGSTATSRDGAEPGSPAVCGGGRRDDDD